MARKRPNGEGSIYENVARGRWEATYYLVDEHGKRRRRTLTAKTQKAVTVRLAEAKAAINQGLLPPDPNLTVGEWSAWWLDNVVPIEGLAPRTEVFYRQIARDYIIPRLGSMTLTGPRAVTPPDVERMGANLEADGYSLRTQQAARATLSKMLRAAEARGLVGRNAARLAKPPKDRGKARRVKALNSNQVRDLLDALDGTPWHPMVVVGVTTGLRPGELLALHWSDLTLSGEPHLTVRHAFSWLTGQPPLLKAPKRERSNRAVPLPTEAVSALKAWRKQQAADRLAAGPLWSPDWPDLVFTTADGRPRQGTTYGHALRDASPDVSPHMLRHTFASHLLEAGTPIHHVAEVLGDAVATVEKTYSHSLRVKHEVADVAATILGGRP